MAELDRADIGCGDESQGMSYQIKDPSYTVNSSAGLHRKSSGTPKHTGSTPSDVSTTVQATTADFSSINSRNHVSENGYDTDSSSVATLPAQDVKSYGKLPFPFSFATAYEILQLYTSGDFNFVSFDQQIIRETLEAGMSPTSPYSQDDISEIGKQKPDLYALVLIVIASAFMMFPSTYPITLGVVENDEQLRKVINSLEEAASITLARLKNPSFEMIQARNIQQHTFAHR